MVQSRREQDIVGTSIVLDQPHEISSPKSITNQGRDVTRGIQPKFVCQFTSPNYYESMEH
jgi:hypothetical protein